MAASSSIRGFRPTASLHAPIAGSVMNSTYACACACAYAWHMYMYAHAHVLGIIIIMCTAALQAVHVPRASATRSGWPIEAAISTPGSACAVTALTEIRLKSAAYSESRCPVCSPFHTASGGGGGGGGGGAMASSSGLVRSEHSKERRKVVSLGHAG